MTLAHKAHLLLLVLAPALCLPRGVGLSWCLCDPVPSSCCGDCCGVRDEPGYASPADRDGCPGCHRVEVVDFDELASVATVELPEAGPSMGTPSSWGVLLAEPPVLRAVAGRAPPRRVTPTGLLPGVAPLRL